MWALAIGHLKYWFRISSILETTKNSTKTSNTSFERSDSRLLKSWRLGAWHSYWPTMPTLYVKLNFLCPLCLCTIFTFPVNEFKVQNPKNVSIYDAKQTSITAQIFRVIEFGLSMKRHYLFNLKVVNSC